MKTTKITIIKEQIIEDIINAYNNVIIAKLEYDDYEEAVNIGYANALEEVLKLYGNLTEEDKKEIKEAKEKASIY